MIGRISKLFFLSGGLLVAAAWIFGVVGVPEPWVPVAQVMAELAAVLTFLLAWRFRRGRAAVAAVIVALSNFLLRGPLAEEVVAGGGGLEVAVLALLLPLNLGILVLLRDRPVPRVPTILHLLVVLCQPWFVVLLIRSGHDSAAVRGAAWLELVQTPQTSLLAFLVAAVFTVLALVLRRGTLESGMLWVLGASALAVHGDRGIVAATMMLGAAQLVLLLGLVEDSYRLAYHDELTGLPGRRALNEALRTLDGDYGIAMVDVDHFKRFNDRHGHDTGDQALKMMADCLRDVGGGGRSFRYGGEEFAVLFPGVPKARTLDALEKLRVAIEQRRFGVRAPKRPRKKPQRPPRRKTATRKVTLTVSIGVARPNARRVTADAVLKAADKALYSAKKAGRNRMISA